MARTLKIKKGWYYGAGSPKKYGWVNDGYHIWGVGIARDYFNDEKINIIVDGEQYTCDMTQARDFVRKYKSHYTIGGTRIGVISRDLLKQSGEDQFESDVAWFDALP